MHPAAAAAERWAGTAACPAAAGPGTGLVALQHYIIFSVLGRFSLSTGRSWKKSPIAITCSHQNPTQRSSILAPVWIKKRPGRYAWYMCTSAALDHILQAPVVHDKVVIDFIHPAAVRHTQDRLHEPQQRQAYQLRVQLLRAGSCWHRSESIHCNKRHCNNIHPGSCKSRCDRSAPPASRQKAGGAVHAPAHARGTEGGTRSGCPSCTSTGNRSAAASATSSSSSSSYLVLFCLTSCLHMHYRHHDAPRVC